MLIATSHSSANRIRPIVCVKCGSILSYSEANRETVVALIEILLFDAERKVNFNQANWTTNRGACVVDKGF